jgi:hypothetical protein
LRCRSGEALFVVVFVVEYVFSQSVRWGIVSAVQHTTLEGFLTILHWIFLLHTKNFKFQFIFCLSIIYPPAPLDRVVNFNFQ